MNIPKTALFALCFTVKAFFSYCQTDFQLEDLTFHTRFEANLFNALSSAESDADLALLLASSSELDENGFAEVQSVLKNIFRELEAKGIRDKAYKKAVKIIYKYVQKNYLLQYTLLTPFAATIKTGQFNCVTATALYALILEHFDIPYNIQLQPHHAYLLIDPEGKEIILESTDPVDGIKQINEKQKLEQIKKLINAKLISQEAWASKSIDDLYDQHYLASNQTINLRQLASAQYYNEALLQLSLANYQKGLVLLEKSEFLYQVPRNTYLMLVCIYQLMNKVDYHNPETLNPLFKLYRLQPSHKAGIELIRQFAFVSEQFLFEYPDPQIFEQYYTTFVDKISDANFLNNINEIYFVQKARAASLNYQNDEALKYIDLAFRNNPSDLRVKRLLAGMVLDKLRSLNSNKLVQHHYEAFIKDYPFLLENPQIRVYQMLSDLTETTKELPEEESAEIQLLLEDLEISTASPKAGSITEMLKVPHNNALLHYYGHFNHQGEILRWLRNSLQFDSKYELFSKVLKMWETPGSVILSGKSVLSWKPN